ncbi:MAG: hypothetical protein AAB413_03925 [Patescibacteria group bacterium]
MKFEKLLLSLLVSLILLMSTGLVSRGIAKVERRVEVFPIISESTVTLMEKLGASKDDFGRACDCYKKGALATAYDGTSCEGIANEAALTQATERRMQASAELDPSLLMAWVLGVVDKTHSTWQCSGTAYESVFDFNMSLSPTYDLPAS